MKIFVTSTFNHHRFHVTTLDRPGDDNLGGLKLLIWLKTGMAPREQQISFRGKILDDYMTKLNDYGIGDGATLHLDHVEVKEDPLKIFVTMFNHRFPFDVDGGDRLGAFKHLVWDKGGVPPSKQKLSFNGEILKDNDRKLKDYGIGDGATLCFEGICIHVVTVAGQTIQIEAVEDTTIGNVQWRLERFHNFPWKQQRLSFNGELLHAGRKLSDYNIGDKAIINLVIVPGA